MKISKIEFENFRNFKDHGEIRCSTDGKVTIIYGKNGDGKTTLHQLFQWILYGKVNFNRTTTDRLYNLQYESECHFGDTFSVMGSIDFEHDNKQYSVRRIYKYRKGVSESEKISEDFLLLRMDEENNWCKIEYPKEAIEKLLPSGLSDYFFFDGESMIADLRVKGKDSASKLRKALYSMFDLDILESAIAHIGRTDLKTTVLGILYKNKSMVSSNGKISNVRINFENAQNMISKYEGQSEDAKKQLKECRNALEELSEKIGNTKSKKEYEKKRREKKAERDRYIKSALDAQAYFGDEVVNMFPNILIGKAVSEAKDKIHLKISQSRLPDGITKKLINHLMSQKTKTCICGQEFTEEAKRHIKAYLDLLPPKSYGSLYQEFTKTAERWSSGFDEAKLDYHIKTVLDYNQYAAKCDNEITELDNEEKKSPDVEDLIIERQKAEAKQEELIENISHLDTEIRKYTIYKDRQMKNLDELTKNNVASEKINVKIQIMEQVAAFFRKKLDEASKAYSEKLELNIQDLINDMLTSSRVVNVSPEFSVKVTDHFNDESKSEGQFAVVSFAYIGGILKMLKSEERLSSKEYPLVLDGPFSKLDYEQRQNVVNIIPQFAPQVILFSKDDLHDVFSKDMIGRVWTIESNLEKNVACVKEGKLWK